MKKVTLEAERSLKNKHDLCVVAKGCFAFDGCRLTEMVVRTYRWRCVFSLISFLVVVFSQALTGQRGNESQTRLEGMFKADMCGWRLCGLTFVWSHVCAVSCLYGLAFVRSHVYPVWRLCGAVCVV